MGCWNKTCGISRLHINAGDPVYVFILEKSKNNSDRCYATAFFSPVLLPFESFYDDYGGGINSSGAGLDLLMTGLSQRLVERNQGPNKYHDIPVNKESFTVNKFFEAVHEGRLSVTNPLNENSEVDFVMLRKDIVDNIFENWIRKRYVANSNGYIIYKFEDVVADVPAFLDRLGENLKSFANQEKMMADIDTALKAEKESGANTPSVEKITALSKILTSLLDDAKVALTRGRGLESVYSWEEQHLNKVSWYMMRDAYRYSNIVNVGEIIVELMSKGERDLAQALLVDHLKAIHIDHFYDITRNIWAPGCHEGSQSCDHDGYRVLTQAINKVLDVEKAEFEDEADE